MKAVNDTLNHSLLNNPGLNNAWLVSFHNSEGFWELDNNVFLIVNWLWFTLDI